VRHAGIMVMRALSQGLRMSTRNRVAAAGVLGVSVALWLSGCSPSPAPSGQADDAPSGGTVQVPVAPDAEDAVPEADLATSTGETVGGDGSAIRLDALAGDDVSNANLSGELACSFTVDGAAPLLLAKGIVASDEPAQGIVKVSGYVEPIRAPGGFDGVLRGATFTGQGKTIVIAVTGAAIGGGESPPVPATLTYQRADGASRVFEGRWQCGP
jgi:hypothetical protein